jgi:hypothetical protein
METPGPLGHQDFATPDKQKSQPSISSRGPQGVEPDRGRAILESERGKVTQALRNLQKLRIELAEKMTEVIKQEILGQYDSGLEEIGVSPEVKKQIKDKISAELARTLNPQTASVEDYAGLESIGFSWKLVQRHKKLLSDFLDAVEMYLKARKESKQSGGFLPKSSKDTLSEYWDWSEELLKEYAITGAMGDENLAHNVVWETAISLLEEASWDAFEIYEKAYKEWGHDKQSPAKKDKLAESSALLTANLSELSQLDPYSDTMTEIGKRVLEMASSSSQSAS